MCPRAVVETGLLGFGAWRGGWTPWLPGLAVTPALSLLSGGTPRLAVDLAAVVHCGLLPLHRLPLPGSHPPLVSSVSGTSAVTCADRYPGMCSLAPFRRQETGLDDFMAPQSWTGSERVSSPSIPFCRQRKGISEVQRKTLSHPRSQSTARTGIWDS